MNRLSTAMLVLAWPMMAMASQAKCLSFVIDTRNNLQTMEHFGASDCWSMQHVGRWNERVQQQVADWLFSTENDSSGKPKGIGLSLWRFNVGAGSAEQGEESQIGSPWTRSEGFMTDKGDYDWNKLKGQRRFLKLAKERGVPHFLAFLNSPPVRFTQNGLATNTGRGGTLNLKEEHYLDFARYMADVVQGVERHDGIHFDYICPFNEPDGHWNWTGPKQEGTPATKQEMARVVRLLDAELTRRNIDTDILVSESSDYRCMFATHMTDASRGYQIQSFFSNDSTETCLRGLRHVKPLMVGHSYWTNTPLQTLRDIRKELRDTLDKYRVDFWQTETCIMGNDEEIGGGGGYDFTMKTALYVARIIHHDIVYAGAKSWQWWRAVGGDYKDGLLREYANRDLTDGEVKDSKLLWTLGHYSRFVRPKAVRKPVAAQVNGTVLEEGDTRPQALMVTAYQNRDGSYAVVIINYAREEQQASFGLGRQTKKKWKIYRTSDAEGEDLKPVGEVAPGRTITLPARSMTTLLMD